jgi:chromosome segregation protein
MKLKRLEIIGFKSFRDRTVIDFSTGISGIVGPNGCGKSNIVDAIRWVMGEQRVSLLRGKKMDDVIFNGSEEAQPVSMAEVTLVMEAAGYSFPAPYGDCSEVMITRRVFRDEEGEYSINKVRCRLLDVKEFFMDTGVGARTYSLVEQGSIANLMEAKPEERRQYLEEAAGITKYKSRKEAAVRKMESTKQNMLRLNDILREVKSQLNSVSRQAKRAERYKLLKKDLREIELALAVQAFTEMLEKKTSLQRRFDESSASTEDIRSGLSVLEARVEEFRAEIAENDQNVKQLQERLYTAKNEISIQEQGIEHARGRLDDLATLKERSTIELESLRARKGEAQRELETLRLQSSESDGRILSGREALALRQSVVDELKKSEQTLRDDLEKDKTAYFNSLTEQSRLQNAMAAYGKSLEDLKRRTEREVKELEEHETRLNLAQENLASTREGLEGGQEQLDGLRREAAELQQLIQRSRNELEEADGKVFRLKEELGKKSSRLASLREFQDRYEWCDAGTRSIIRARDEAGLALDSIYGLAGGRSHRGPPRIRDRRRGGPGREAPVCRREEPGGGHPGHRLPENQRRRAQQFCSAAGPEQRRRHGIEGLPAGHDEAPRRRARERRVPQRRRVSPGRHHPGARPQLRDCPLAAKRLPGDPGHPGRRYDQPSRGSDGRQPDRHGREQPASAQAGNRRLGEGREPSRRTDPGRVAKPRRSGRTDRDDGRGLGGKPRREPRDGAGAPGQEEGRRALRK